MEPQSLWGTVLCPSWSSRTFFQERRGQEDWGLAAPEMRGDRNPASPPGASVMEKGGHTASWGPQRGGPRLHLREPPFRHPPRWRPLTQAGNESCYVHTLEPMQLFQQDEITHTGAKQSPSYTMLCKNKYAPLECVCLHTCRRAHTPVQNVERLSPERWTGTW